VATSGGLRGDAVLRLPVRARGIELGHPTDLIVDLEGGRALGLDVICGDRRQRFLPLAAATIEPDRIAVTSALILLDDLGADFYRRRADALRSLRGRDVSRRGRTLGRLVDVVLGPDSTVRALLVDGELGELVVPLEEHPEVAAV
jgi:hypothetical protein